MYLALMEGDDPRTTRPVLMTRDRELLRAFADALETRIRESAASDSGRRETLELVRDEAGEERSGD